LPLIHPLPAVYEVNAIYGIAVAATGDYSHGKARREESHMLKDKIVYERYVTILIGAAYS
jgi:hypothetical protein